MIHEKRGLATTLYRRYSVTGLSLVAVRFCICTFFPHMGDARAGILWKRGIPFERKA